MTGSHDKHIYAGLMKPAFVEGLSQVGHELESDMLIIRWAECQRSVVGLLEQVDWENSGLEDHPFRSPDADTYYGPEVLTPREYANRLAIFAFDDVRVVLQQADAFLERTCPGRAKAPVLRNSTSLMRIARLADSYKEGVRKAIETEWGIELVGPTVPRYEGPPFVIVEDGDELGLEWTPQLSEWIEMHIQPDSGCPAYNMPVMHPDGRRMGLVAYVWDAIIVNAYDN